MHISIERGASRVGGELPRRRATLAHTTNLSWSAMRLGVNDGSHSTHHADN
ncbi:MAG: hypothetical protein ACREUR_08900 [Nitrosospira sp.]